MYGSSQESEERRRQEAELARLQRDRGEGEEVPLGTVGREVGRDHQVELRLRCDEESDDSDDGPEARESEGEASSFQTFLQQQHKDA